MQRYFVEIAYDGTRYSGWQIQPNAKTIQEAIEKRLSQLYGNFVFTIVGCGRTDSGVHANQFYFHVDLFDRYSVVELIYKLNSMLPPDIAIHDVHRVDNQCHARFDASSRTYRYFLHRRKAPFLHNYSLYFPKYLNIDQMNKACEMLKGERDFTSFSKLHTDVKTNLCTVFSARWFVQHKDQLVFEISANRFLRNMVRAIVGTLLEVGQGNITLIQFKAILAAKDRGAAGVSVPAKGLFLESVSYSFLALD